MPFQINATIPDKTVEQDDTCCLSCDNATMGHCKARDRSVRPFDNCSDFDSRKLYVLRPNFFTVKEKEND